MMRSALRFACLVGLGLVTLGGCGSKGPKLGAVTGKVTLDGQPLPNAIVTFTPVNGGIASTGETNAQGEYELVCQLGKGAVVGQHKVSVRTKPPVQAAASEVRSDDPAYQYGGESSANAPVFVEKIPPKYNVQTELVFEVKPGTNQINLDLKSTP